MAKYHVNPATGAVNICKAQYECRYGANMPHFADKDEAAAFFSDAMRDSTVYLQEKEHGRLNPIREGYLQGKLHPRDLRPGDIVRRKVTAGNTTFWDYREIISFDAEKGSAVERQVSPQNEWKPVPEIGAHQPGGPSGVKDRNVSFPLNNEKASAMVFVLREKPANWAPRQS